LLFAYADCNLQLARTKSDAVADQVWLGIPDDFAPCLVPNTSPSQYESNCFRVGVVEPEMWRGYVPFRAFAG
jgi:hypothetical protein